MVSREYDYRGVATTIRTIHRITKRSECHPGIRTSKNYFNTMFYFTTICFYLTTILRPLLMYMPEAILFLSTRTPPSVYTL